MRYSVHNQSVKVGEFDDLKSAKKALYKIIQQWRAARYRNAAVQCTQIYDHIPKEYSFRQRGTEVGRAYIWDHKGESPEEVNKALDHYWVVVEQIRREQEEARGEAPWQKEIAGG